MGETVKVHARESRKVSRGGRLASCELAALDALTRDRIMRPFLFFRTDLALKEARLTEALSRGPARARVTLSHRATKVFPPTRFAIFVSFSTRNYGTFQAPDS